MDEKLVRGAAVNREIDEATAWVTGLCDAFATANDLESVASLREEMGDRDSSLALLSRSLKSLDPADRPSVGQAVGALRRKLQEAYDGAESRLARVEEELRLQAETDDLTSYLFPGTLVQPGSLQPSTVMREELEDIFVSLGFEVAGGPEVETEWYNFEALNIPRAHPARDGQDSFYVDLGEPETRLLRTHTSPVQIRLMQTRELPLYAVMPGRVYRRDTPDSRHLPTFHQIECLVVDEGITFAHLAGTIEAFTREYFGTSVKSRLRPAYFPFTEPSAEFEVTCTLCLGSGCRTCSHTGWIELGGSGMVHPNVFRAVGIDPERYSGFAFGFGIDRLAQMRFGIPDMRVLGDNDTRALSHWVGLS